MMKRIDKILQSAIVRNNLLSSSQMQKNLQKAQDKGVALKTFLLNHKLLNEKQILVALSQFLNLEIIDFHTRKIDAAIIERVPVKFVWYYKFMPIAIENDVLLIASANPLDIKTLDEIRMHLGLGIKILLSAEKPLLEAIKQYYGLAADTIDKIMNSDDVLPKNLPTTGSQDWIEDLELKNDDPTVANLVNQIILEAYNKRATDIHIEPYRDKVRIRYRIDGVLINANLPDNVKHFLAPILSRIKIMANLSITERRLPQDGSAVVKTNEQQLDLRISTMPTPRGESIVVRILPTKIAFLSLEKLAYNPESVRLIRDMIEHPHGIIFMTGPTGSGKTTTLYACLKEINSSQRKIITIEDPIEYEMEEVTQVQVNAKVGFDFSTGLRSLLRHDPDVMMVGEVRDIETAEISVRTALTGHLVFSTLHTNDAASGVTRLIDMGIEPYLVASSVQAFVGQRLVRLICEGCKEESQEESEHVRGEIRQALNLPANEKVIIYKGRGCEQCNNTGYLGRIAICEVLKINDNIRAAILEKPRSDYIKKIAVKDGMKTLRQNGWKAVLEGVTTPQEVINATVRDEEFLEEKSAKPQHVKEVEDKNDGFVKIQDAHVVNVRNQKEWVTQKEYEGRVYERTFEPVHVRYQLLKKDEDDVNVLISDGIEYSTISQDISAGGLRFMTKSVFPIGSILELQINFGANKRSVKCLAKVCRVEKDSMDNVYTIVNYYLDMTSEDRVNINKFVESSQQTIKAMEKEEAV